MSAEGKTVLVLGLGESGLAMAQWLDRQGARVRVADSRAEPPFASELKLAAPAVELLAGSFSPGLLDGVDRLGLSPGLALDEPLVVQALARGIPVIGEIELFAQALRDLGWRDGCRVVAITGTNGKTTTTALVGEMCRAAGKTTAVAGNIGPAALSALMTCLDAGRMPAIWVLELSSFQLETTASLDADAAVVLNVSEDHLDRYSSLADYAAAKARIFEGRGAQVLNRQDERVLAMGRGGRRRLTFGLDVPAGDADFGLLHEGEAAWLARGAERLLRSDELALSGMHNTANALAALALCQAVGLPLAPTLETLRAFRGLSHRVEKIAEIDGVVYYDDSKGTNVGATVAALQGLGRKVVLIAGGDGKGQDFSPLGPVLASHGRALVLIGRDATRIEAAVAGCGIGALHAQDMQQAVRKAAVAARPGDAVLLSPACASFDMFRNYAHRAEVFTQAVRELAVARQRELS
jgi:UDP-N-acetylmuramoylalanine--D-glutamate ligase